MFVPIINYKRILKKVNKRKGLLIKKHILNRKTASIRMFRFSVRPTACPQSNIKSAIKIPNNRFLFYFSISLDFLISL